MKEVNCIPVLTGLPPGQYEISAKGWSDGKKLRFDAPPMVSETWFNRLPDYVPPPPAEVGPWLVFKLSVLAFFLVWVGFRIGRVTAPDAYVERLREQLGEG